MESFAILIDYENFACPPEGLQQFLADFSKRGAIVVKRAYADWVKYATHRQELLANQVEMIELPCASKGKNSVDIRLVVDAMELVFTKPYVASFVIASADADYLPLLSRLREYNKRTIVVSNKANAHLVTTGFLRIELTNGSNERIFLVTRESHKRPSFVAATGD